MSRIPIWLLACFVVGVALGALATGVSTRPRSSATEPGIDIPDEALSPRHDAAAFENAFASIPWTDATEPDGTPSPSGLSGWRLLGVVSAESGPVAILLHDGGSPLVRATENTALPGGAIVTGIEGTRVHLRDEAGCILSLGMPAHPKASVQCPP
jgi:hypothetical protein